MGDTKIILDICKTEIKIPQLYAQAASQGVDYDAAKSAIMGAINDGALKFTKTGVKSVENKN